MKLLYSLLCVMCSLSCVKRIVVEEAVNQNGGGAQTVIAPDRKPALVVSMYDQNCTPEKALRELGSIMINVNSGGKQEKVPFDFSGVSGLGLKSQYSLGSVSSYVWEETYKDCVSVDKQNFSCQSSTVAENPGQLVPICSVPKDGFPLYSIENIALVTMAAYIKSFRSYEITLDTLTQSPSREIGILVLPTFRRIFQMTNGTTYTRYDLDNARWTSRVVPGYGWKYAIEFLPHSAQYMQGGQGNEYFLQMGIASHETGHHNFASRVGKLKRAGFSGADAEAGATELLTSYLAGSSIRNINIRLPIGALDECYADMTAHYVFKSSLNPYFQFFTANDQSRRVSAGEINGSNDQIKSLSAALIQNFFKQRWSSPPDSFTPNHQDIHSVGAILANIADRLFAEKAGATLADPKTNEKFEMANVWATEVAKAYAQQEALFSKVPEAGYGPNPAQYTSGPALFLEQIAWVMVNTAALGGNASEKTLNQAQCNIVSTQLPVYAQKWLQQKRYKCV